MSQFAKHGSLRYRRAESKNFLIDKQVPRRHAANVWRRNLWVLQCAPCEKGAELHTRCVLIQVNDVDLCNSWIIFR